MLTALVISIIVLLILAGVAFSTLAGENGVINRAQKAVSKNKQAIALEEISLAWTELIVDWSEDWSKQPGVTLSSFVTKENLQKYIGSSGTIGEVTNNGNKTHTIEYTVNDNEAKKYLFLANENGRIELASGLIVSPKEITLDYFTNKNTQTSQTIIAGLQSIDGPVSWQATTGADVVSLSSTSGNSIQITPLKAGTATIKASAENGNYEDNCTITVTEKIAVESIGSLVATATTVNKGSTATITLPNLNPQNATENLDWSSSDSTVATVTPSEDTKSATIAGVKAGGPVTITVTTANGASSTIDITVVQPVTVTFMLDGVQYTTKNTIAGATVSDWPADPTKSGTTFEGWFDAQTEEIKYTSETTINGNITLYGRWKTPKIAPSNTATTNSSLTMSNARGEIEVIWLDGKTNSKASTANSPDIPEGSGMTPVTWSLNNTTHKWVEDSPAKSTWYNYRTTTGNNNEYGDMANQWANVKLSGSYFVWIPRFAYRITYYDTSDNIVGYYDGYGLWTANGSSKRTFTDIVSTDEIDGKKYIVHNAFLSNANNGGGFTTENPASGEDGISGFWVAKYEMSNSSNSPVSVPEADSWRTINIGDCYTKSLNYNTTLKSHLMKNSEWGAVAYLAHSQYGLNGEEIRINNYYSGTFRTGQAAKTADANYTTDTYTYNLADSNGNPLGPLASTTKNIYGIYDMSGGANEYVAAYNKNYTAGTYFGASYGKNMVDAAKSGSNYISTKYITAYNGTSNYQGTDIYSVGRTGDATKEVFTNTQVANSSGTNVYRNWNLDYSVFVNSSSPFFLRGGTYSNGAGAGLFYSYYCNGAAYSGVRFPCGSGSFSTLIFPSS